MLVLKNQDGKPTEAINVAYIRRVYSLVGLTIIECASGYLASSFASVEETMQEIERIRREESEQQARNESAMVDRVIERVVAAFSNQASIIRGSDGNAAIASAALATIGIAQGVKSDEPVSSEIKGSPVGEPAESGVAGRIVIDGGARPGSGDITPSGSPASDIAQPAKSDINAPGADPDPHPSDVDELGHWIGPAHPKYAEYLKQCTAWTDRRLQRIHGDPPKATTNDTTAPAQTKPEPAKPVSQPEHVNPDEQQ